MSILPGEACMSSVPRFDGGLGQIPENIVTYFETGLVENAAGLPSAFAVLCGSWGMMQSRRCASGGAPDEDY
jgi:hypothetical protein